MFEPPVNRLIAETSTLFDGPDPAVSVAVSERSASDTSVEKVSLAARVDPGSAPATSPPLPGSMNPRPPVHDPGEPAAEPVTIQSTAPVAPAPPLRFPDLQRIEMLRVQLEECRIRRDEFYLQNDEEGYRREVHRMTNLAREIGDIEKAR